MKSTSTWWKILLSGLLLAGTLVANADTYQPSYSTAGFYQLSNTGRTVYNMNPAWRFYKGNIEGAEMEKTMLSPYGQTTVTIPPTLPANRKMHWTLHILEEFTEIAG